MFLYTISLFFLFLLLVLEFSQFSKESLRFSSRPSLFPVGLIVSFLTFNPGILETREVKASMVIMLIFMTSLSWICGFNPLPEGVISSPNLGSYFGAFVQLGNPDLITTTTAANIFSIFAICLFDLSAVVYACTQQAGLLTAQGTVPKQYWIFVACAIGSILGGFYGKLVCMMQKRMDDGLDCKYIIFSHAAHFLFFIVFQDWIWCSVYIYIYIYIYMGELVVAHATGGFIK